MHDVLLSYSVWPPHTYLRGIETSAHEHSTMAITLADQDQEIEPVPTIAGAGLPEPEMDHLSNILRAFNELFGNIEWQDSDKIGRVIAEEIPAKVAADTAYRTVPASCTVVTSMARAREALAQRHGAWSLHPRGGATPSWVTVAMKRFKTQRLGLFLCQVPFDLVTISVVIGQRGVDLGQRERGMAHLIADLLGHGAKFVPGNDAPNRHASARHMGAPAVQAGRPRDQRAYVGLGRHARGLSVILMP